MRATETSRYAALTVQVRPLIWVLGGAAAFIAATIVLVVNMYDEPPVSEPEQHVGSAWEDFAAQRQREQQHLHSYGWVDQQRQIAHIPIEQAMRLMLEQRAADIRKSEREQEATKP